MLLVFKPPSVSLNGQIGTDHQYIYDITGSLGFSLGHNHDKCICTTQTAQGTTRLTPSAIDVPSTLPETDGGPSIFLSSTTPTKVVLQDGLSKRFKPGLMTHHLE